ncbi:MAG: HD domain-containing phosphohydrolase [Rubrivivax sp.]
MSRVSPDQRMPIGEVADLIRVGEPLPFRVLDALERLLLNEGQVIASERQMEVLKERGAWVERSLVMEQRERLSRAPGAGRSGVARVVTLFDRWERQLWELDALLRRTLKGQHQADEWAAEVDAVRALVDRDADVALFMAVRQDDRRFALYPQAHALHAAVVVLLAARALGWAPERQRSLVGAALSMNVAMLELQAAMAEQDEPPTQRQLDVIRAHPEAGVRLLQAVGIDDAAWLQAVTEHHERADGSGYPGGRVQVGDEARLLRMADVYMAKITPRAKRPPLAPQLASRQLFQAESGSPLAMSMIKAIGIHPPGALVQLKSGEVAVVKRRGTGPAPRVCTLSDARGHPSVQSRELDSAEPAHAIAGPAADTAAYARVPGERVYGLLLA